MLLEQLVLPLLLLAESHQPPSGMQRQPWHCVMEWAAPWGCLPAWLESCSLEWDVGQSSSSEGFRATVTWLQISNMLKRSVIACSLTQQVTQLLTQGLTVGWEWAVYESSCQIHSLLSLHLLYTSLYCLQW